MLAPVTHILPITTIRRERLLPISGKVLVRKGQKVSATDTIAEANLSPEHQFIDVARGLGISEEKAEARIQVKPGAQVAEGDVLAGPVGLTRRVVRATRNGRVVTTGDGQVLLEAAGKPFQLKAGIPGEVVDLIPERGATIETSGALIQGVWGNGRLDFGLLSMLADTPEHQITPDQVDVSLRGAIVLAGYCESAEVLKAAADLPLRGLILTGMDPSLAAAAGKLPIPVMLIDGFGQRVMNTAAYKLLSTSDRREVALNAEIWDRYKGTRPEAIIPLPSSGELPLPRETDEFAPGQQVRVLRSPYAGKIGTLLEVRGLAVFPNGLRSLGAEVRLENGETVILPLANLEVLE